MVQLLQIPGRAALAMLGEIGAVEFLYRAHAVLVGTAPLVWAADSAADA